MTVSLHNLPLGRNLGVREAYDALDAFGQRFGEQPLLLLLHLAVPQSFRADLVNLIKINFLDPRADLSVDAEVLFSPLVEETAGGFHRLDANVRRHCLMLLDAAYRNEPERRSVQVARLLFAYIENAETQGTQIRDPLLAEYLAVHRWVAIAFIDPEQAAAAFASVLREATDHTEGAAWLQLGSVTSAIEIPLAGQQDLLAYARGLGALITGEADEAWRIFSRLGEDEIVVDGVTLRPPQDVLARFSVVARRRGAGPRTGVLAEQLSGEGELLEPSLAKSRLEPADFYVFRDIEAPWCPEMVALPAGEFLMGSPKGEKERYNDELPQHPVTIGQRFALGRYPVTFYEYNRFCTVTYREKPDDKGFGQGNRPVINVSWRDAAAYCERLSKETGHRYRLPSEAEWEYACRAGGTMRYSFGDEMTENDGNYGRLIEKTTEVGSFAPNPWGIFDMHGNVWEWVEDDWHDSYSGAPNDGSAWLNSARQVSDDRLRVVRGGSWNVNPRVCRSASRYSVAPDYRHSNIGFRVARPLE